MSPIKNEFLANYSNQKIILTGNGKNPAIKLSMEGSVLLVSVN